MWPEELFLVEKDPGNTVNLVKKVEKEVLEEDLTEDVNLSTFKKGGAKSYTFKIY
jgi:hypothetical protein